MYPPLSLYMHFPWCIAKCPYCDFNSHSLTAELPADDYIDALIHELGAAALPVADRRIESVFLGGGTPSLFDPSRIKRLLEAVADHLNLSKDAEITMEANPGAIEHGAFGEYRSAGINRLSLGVQSFAEKKLKGLGRIHDARAAEDAFHQARAAGFDNINLDLMYALPKQTLDEALSDVTTAIALRPEHISYYQLTLEPNTVFYARPPALPDQDVAWEMQIAASDLLTSAGYANYEVSAWALADRECRHNLNYWQFGDYLGLGAGAHSKLTRHDGTVEREQRVAHPREYLKRKQTSTAVANRSVVAKDDLIFEFMLNNLRLRRGFSLDQFSRRTGLEFAAAMPGLSAARQRGLILDAGAGRWRPTERGWRFLDDLQANFLPESD